MVEVDISMIPSFYCPNMSKEEIISKDWLTTSLYSEINSLCPTTDDISTDGNNSRCAEQFRVKVGCFFFY